MFLYKQPCSRIGSNCILGASKGDRNAASRFRPAERDRACSRKSSACALRSACSEQKVNSILLSCQAFSSQRNTRCHRTLFNDSCFHALCVYPLWILFAQYFSWDDNAFRSWSCFWIYSSLRWALLHPQKVYMIINSIKLLICLFW